MVEHMKSFRDGKDALKDVYIYSAVRGFGQPLVRAAHPRGRVSRSLQVLARSCISLAPVSRLPREIGELPLEWSHLIHSGFVKHMCVLIRISHNGGTVLWITFFPQEMWHPYRDGSYDLLRIPFKPPSTNVSEIVSSLEKESSQNQAAHEK